MAYGRRARRTRGFLSELALGALLLAACGHADPIPLSGVGGSFSAGGAGATGAGGFPGTGAITGAGGLPWITAGGSPGIGGGPGPYCAPYCDGPHACTRPNPLNCDDYICQEACAYGCAVGTVDGTLQAYCVPDPGTGGLGGEGGVAN